MTLGARPLPVRVGSVFAQTPARLVAARTSVIVEAKQNAKRRLRVIKRNTLYNRHYLDLVASSSRKAMKGYVEMMGKSVDVRVEADLKPVDDLLSVAFSNIDKAVVKGVLHKNTGGRRKAKITTLRKRVLAVSGIWPPAAAPESA